MTAALDASAAALDIVSNGRARRTVRRRVVIAILAVLVVGGYLVSLLFGQTAYSITEVARVVLGEDVPGASFTVGTLRLPGRASPSSPACLSGLPA